MAVVKYFVGGRVILGGCKSPQPSRTYRRLLTSRRRFLLGEGQELSQSTDYNNVAVTTSLRWMNFDMAYE